MKKEDRRSFLKGCGAASVAVWQAGSARRVLGANERIRGAIIGSGGRGRFLTANFKEIGVEMAAVCDVYEPNLQAGLKEASAGAKPYDNYRRVLEDKTIDVVAIATPDHWHAQMAIDAVEAGKDVYVEKPMAHTIADGFRIIEAVRRTKRVVQVGMQRRSFDLFQEAKQIVDSGHLAQVRLVNSWWLNSTPAKLAQPTLQGKLDWNEWLGPAPKRPLDPRRFRSWYWFWDYCGGMMVGQGAHVVDAIMWFMHSSYPVSLTSSGKLTMEGAEVPESTCTCIEFPEYLVVFTVDYKAMRYSWVNDQLNQFHGAKARLDVGRESYALYLEDPNAIDLKASAEKRKPGAFEGATAAHIRNFLECVRSRKDPNATVEMGQSTTIVLSMAMDALRTGKRVRYNPATRTSEG